MKIRHLTFFFSLLACAFTHAWAEDIIQMLPLRTTPGIATADNRSVDFVLNSTAADNVWGYQLDIVLPEGMQFDDSQGSPFTLKAERHPASPAPHHIDYAHLVTGVWRIIVTPDDDTRINGKEGLILQARYTTANNLKEGLYPIQVKRSMIATDGAHGTEPVLSTSYFVVGDSIKSTMKHVDFNEATGLLPTFVVDSLNKELSANQAITWLDIRQVDQLGKTLNALQNANALIIAKAGTSHATRENTLAWAQNATPVCTELYLDEASGSFEMPFDFHATHMEMARTLYKTMWNTLCLPFAMTTEQIHDLLGQGTQIGVYEDFRNDTLLFLRQDTTTHILQANTPYLIKAGTAIDALEFSDFDLIKPNTLEQNINNFVFLGTYEGKKPIPSGCYFVSNNKFWKTEGASFQRPFRAYFRDDRGGAGVKELSFAFWEPGDFDEDDDFKEDEELKEDDEEELKPDEEDDTTVINGIPVRISNKPIYTLQGQRVVRPKRGIYICDGRKIFIK